MKNNLIQYPSIVTGTQKLYVRTVTSKFTWMFTMAWLKSTWKYIMNVTVCNRDDNPKCILFKLLAYVCLPAYAHDERLGVAER